MANREYGKKAFIIAGDIQINRDKWELLVKAKPITVTPMEFRLLFYLALHKNALVSKETISEKILGKDMQAGDKPGSVYSHIKNLRKVLRQAGSEAAIDTVYGMGYRLVV